MTGLTAGRLPGLAGPGPRRSVAGAPRLARVVLPRQRLADRLDRRAPLTVVRGPAGFGKTTLVVSWLAQGGAADDLVVWVTVEQDSARSDVLTQVGAAVEAAGGTTPSGSPVAGLSDLRRLLQRAGHVTLVLDRFERADPALDRDLLDLVGSLPSLHVVVCVRVLRALEPRGRIDVDAEVVTPADLLLTVDETYRLARELGGEPTAEQVEALHTELGGWPGPTRAGLLPVRGATPEPPRGTGVDWQGIDEYLVQELDSIAATAGHQTATVLLRLSVAAELTVARAAVLAPQIDAAETLAALCAEGLLERVDASDAREGAAYHFPAGVRRLLDARLRSTDPRLHAELHHALAMDGLAHDDPHLALAHAASVEDWGLVVDILDEHLVGLLCDHSRVTIQVLAAVPAELLAGNLALTVARTFLSEARVSVLGDADERLTVLDAVPEQAVGAPPGADQVGPALARLITLRTLGHFDAAEAVAVAHQHLVVDAAIGGDAAQVALARLHWGILRLLRADMRAATGDFSVAYGAGLDARIPFLARNAAGDLALLHTLTGDLSSARAWLERAEAIPEPPGPLWGIARTAEVTARILLAVAGLDLAGARAALSSLGEVRAREELWAPVEYARAAVDLLAGQAHVAQSRLDRVLAEHVSTSRPGSFADLVMTAVSVDLLIALGQGTRAASALAASPAHPVVDVRRARRSLLVGDHDEVVRLAAGVVWAPSALARNRVDMWVLEAVAEHRAGRADQAAVALTRAAEESCASGLLQPFTQVPRADLEEIASSVSSPAVDAVLADLAGSGIGPVLPPVLPTVELTERERVVLEHLERTPSTQLIASRLFVSTNTVKTQVRTIYQKLEVHSRDEALAAAHRLGLLHR